MAAPVFSSGARTRKVVALTFDDGSNAANTLQILQILEQSKVNATFFPIGKHVVALASVWRSVAAVGFPIANHTYDHATLTGLCYQTQLTELTRDISAVTQTLGITMLPVMRPPGGAYNYVTRQATTGAGERAVILWDVDTEDWQGLSSSAITTRALAGREGSIVLMHTFPANTATALPAIIAGYRARGFTFVTIGTLLGFGGSVPFR